MTATDPHYEELMVFYSQKDYRGLITYCTHKLAENEGAYLLYGARGKAYLELDEYDKAIDDLTQSLLLNDAYPMGRYNRGVSYFFRRNYVPALADLEAVKLSGINVDVDYYLSLCYYHTDQLKAAIRLFTSLLESGDVTDFLLECRSNAYSLTGFTVLAFDDQLKRLGLQLESIPDLETINEPTTVLTSPGDTNELWAGFNELNFLSQPDTSQPVIYILVFTNQEYYVGQAKNIHHRLKQHRKTYPDIERVYYKVVPLSALLIQENATIATLQRACLRIRNLKQLDFSTLFDSYAQRQWIDNLDYSYNSGTKYANSVVREQFASQFNNFRQKTYADELTRQLATYVAATIPNYLASEYTYWSCSCLPKHLKHENVVSRINIHAVPVLSAYEEDDGTLGFMLYVSKLPFLQQLDQGATLEYLVDQLPSFQIELREAFTSQTQGDELTLLMNQLDFEKALSIPLIRSSCRLFNLRLMNRTGNEVTYRRTVWHCVDLADHLHSVIKGL